MLIIFNKISPTVFLFRSLNFSWWEIVIDIFLCYRFRDIQIQKKNDAGRIHLSKRLDITIYLRSNNKKYIILGVSVTLTVHLCQICIPVKRHRRADAVIAMWADVSTQILMLACSIWRICVLNPALNSCLIVHI